MKQIRIGFSRSSGKFPIFSWLIMLVQKTNYSHAYIHFHLDDADREVVFQASGLQVNIVGYPFFKTKETVVKEFELTISDEAFGKMYQYAIDHAGQPYSFLQIINSLIYIICRKHPFDAQIIGWDCSKAVADVLQQDAGLNIPIDLDVITPKDLHDYLEQAVNK